MKLYLNPISSYTQKVLIAFYEKKIPFTPVMVNLMDPAARAEYEKVYPIGKIPFLVDDAGRQLPESSAIIEYLDAKFPTQPPRLVPADRDAAIEARRWECFADGYLNEPMQKVLFDGMRPADQRDPLGVDNARKLIGRAYGVLDKHLAGRTWLSGESISIADCAAAPSLFYLQRVAPFASHRNIAAYAGRMFERPAYVRAINEAMPILKQLGFA